MQTLQQHERRHISLAISESFFYILQDTTATPASARCLLTSSSVVSGSSRPTKQYQLRGLLPDRAAAFRDELPYPDPLNE